MACEREQQVADHSDPDLCQNGISAAAQKRFYLQVLFNRLEEGFDLSAIFIDPSNGRSGQFEVVGENEKMLATFQTVISDETKS